MMLVKGGPDAVRLGLVAGLAMICISVGVCQPLRAWACATNTLPGEPAERVFELTIEDGKVAEDRRTIRVMENDTVHLHWRTDTPLVLHLHGYGIDTEVAPGAVTEVTFAAHTTGRFPVDAHQKGESRAGAHERTPIGYLEVYPR